MFATYNSNTPDDKSIVENAKVARERRALDKKKSLASVKIQSVVRMYLQRRRFRRLIREEFDTFFSVSKFSDNDPSHHPPVLLPAVEVYSQMKRLFLIFDPMYDKLRFMTLCKYLVISMNTQEMSHSYISILFMKEHAFRWVEITKTFLRHCISLLSMIKVELPSEMKNCATLLNVLLIFTSTSTWAIINSNEKRKSLKSSMDQLCVKLSVNLSFLPTLQIILINGLARAAGPLFSKSILSAISTLTIRSLTSNDYSNEIMTSYILHMLSVPAYILHLKNVSPDSLQQLLECNMFEKIINLLSDEQNTKIIFNSLEANYALCLLSNFIQIADIELPRILKPNEKIDQVIGEILLRFMDIIMKLLESCHRYVLSKNSNNSHWHPIFGWFSQKVDSKLHDAMPHVTEQLRMLWGSSMLKRMFAQLLDFNDIQQQIVEASANNTRFSSSPQESSTSKRSKADLPSSSSASGGAGLMRFFKRNMSSKKLYKIDLDGTVSAYTCAACSVYRAALYTLTQMRMDILAGLSYQDPFLPNLWLFIKNLGPQCGLTQLFEVLQTNTNSIYHGLDHPVFDVITLFCEAASHLIIILDDMELFERQKPFSQNDLILLSSFLNVFIFSLLWNCLIDLTKYPDHPILTSTLMLLNVIYERDNRHPFTPEKHWLIKDPKTSVFLSELEKGWVPAQFIMTNMPHVIPFKDRVMRFRKIVSREKALMGIVDENSSRGSNMFSGGSILPPLMITIHRSRMLEDGYRQLAQATPVSLKGTIRVRFLNEQGLDEAGIDQDGVFKEFLEETITRVFDPSLGLFKLTSENKLYPSPTSYIQENHLQLFEFIGRMLGKAVYEGIVVDVPFASFFITQILGSRSATYSFLDELTSLDSTLAKSFFDLKHSTCDIEDLDLTFTCDTECVGKYVTHELIPGGSSIGVTESNKTKYFHMLARFRMYTQIKDQTLAFIHGFRSIISKDWLRMFSARELQQLISGDSADAAIDIGDLRKHTVYYGGYHNNHKVITWLWDILSKDFTDNEKRLFLKFVTSCSKPPLLGFGSLEPPFSIRFVELDGEHDMEMNLGLVLKGFFNIRKKDFSSVGGRLPTSSTCFNVLKLPNYSKKSILRDKLRYAITANAGFELS